MAQSENRKGAAAAVPRMKENPTLMRTHESMVNLMKFTCMNIQANDDFMEFPGIFNDYCGASDDDVYDGDDDDEEEEYDFFSPRPAPEITTPSHPRIREVTDEEAEKFKKEQMEEERRKEKNKRKRMRKKEKKRKEKENAAKNTSPEEQDDESDSGIQEERSTIENKSPVAQMEAAPRKESAIDNKENLATIKQSEEKEGGRSTSDVPKKLKEKAATKIKEVNKSDSNKTESATKANIEKSSSSVQNEIPVQFLLQSDKAKKKSNLNNCNTVQSVTEEMRGQTAAKDKKKENSNISFGFSLEVENPKVVEKSEDQKKKAHFKLMEAPPLKVENSKVVEKSEDQMKKEKIKFMEAPPLKVQNPKVVDKSEDKKKQEVMKNKPVEEETMLNSTAEEFAIKSRELAGAGNHLAAAGKYDVAVNCFTDAIKFNPKEYRLFGNRSLCFERLQQYDNALRDADLALCMEPNWIKGLFRKGKALCGLKRYYEASLVYEEVLKLESSSAEAAQELKRAQTLYLMESGFSWAQSNEALKTHPNLDDAVNSLYASRRKGPATGGSGAKDTKQPKVNSDPQEVGGKTNRPRSQQVRESQHQVQKRSESQSPTPRPKNPNKPELFSVWVGSLVPSVTYSKLHEVFSRVGAIYSIKMLLEQQCAFVNYASKEECDKAIYCFNGMVLEGGPLTVRLPVKGQSGVGSYKKECFFWRTTGCTRSDCSYKHVAENKGLDRDKFTSRLGQFQ